MRLLRNAYVFPLLALIGCGGSSGVGNYGVSGTVRYGDQPLRSGSIGFEPDSAAGNKGPATTAAIVDGKYSTPADAGTVGGPHIVIIYPPELASGSTGADRIHFQPYRTKVDLPKGDSVQDFVVPAK